MLCFFSPSVDSTIFVGSKILLVPDLWKKLKLYWAYAFSQVLFYSVFPCYLILCSEHNWMLHHWPLGYYLLQKWCLLIRNIIWIQMLQCNIYICTFCISEVLIRISFISIYFYPHIVTEACILSQISFHSLFLYMFWNICKKFLNFSVR